MACRRTPVVVDDQARRQDDISYDVRKEVRAQAARRWVDAVNAEGSYGVWEYAVVDSVGEIDPVLHRLAGSKPESP